MKRTLILGVLIAMALAVPTPALAQWLKYPTAGVPRTADGSAHLTAPTPRMPDGKPDLSGLWGVMCELEGRKIFCAPDVAVPPDFGNIGRSLKGGLPYQPWAAELVRQRREQNGKDDPTTHCLPGGISKLHTGALLRKIVQTPALLVFLMERNASYRQIFLDGRPLPDDPNPAWNGYSTGRWEKDTLVVETNGVVDRNWLDRAGSPITESARITERIRRPNYGTLEIDFTVDDRKAYTAPWTTRITQAIVLDTELLDYICLENEKSTQHFVGK